MTFIDNKLGPHHEWNCFSKEKKSEQVSTVKKSGADYVREIKENSTNQGIKELYQNPELPFIHYG